MESHGLSGWIYWKVQGRRNGDVDFPETRYPARLEEFWTLMRQCQDRLKQVEEWKRREPPEMFTTAAEEFETAFHHLSGDIGQLKQALEHISDVMDVMQADFGVWISRMAASACVRKVLIAARNDWHSAGIIALTIVVVSASGKSDQKPRFGTPDDAR